MIWEDLFTRSASGPSWGCGAHPYREPPGGLYSTGNPVTPTIDPWLMLVFRTIRHGVADSYGRLRTTDFVRRAIR